MLGFPLRIACLVLVAAACDQNRPMEPLTQPLSAVVSKTPIEATFTESDPCFGELIQVSIRQQLIVHESVDATGGTHFHFVVNDKGSTATGLTTGATWRQVGATRVGENIRGTAPLAATVVNVLNFIGTGATPNLLIHQVIHLTVNAQGVLTAEVDRSTVACR